VVQLGGTAEGTARVVAERSELPEYPLTISTGEEHVWALSSALSISASASAGPSTRRRSRRCRFVGYLHGDLARHDKWLWFVEAHAEGAVKAHLKD